MKQTAIEWLVEQINSDCLNSTFVRNELIEQAKEMERREKAEEYIKGFKDGSNHIKITYNI